MNHVKKLMIELILFLFNFLGIIVASIISLIKKENRSIDEILLTPWLNKHKNEELKN